MSRIAFILDFEEGHLFPSFGLAHALQNAGHEIIYVSVPDNEDFIRNEEFAFYPLFEKYYPKGFRSTYKQRKENQQTKKNQLDARVHLPEVHSPSFKAFLDSINPDYYIISGFLSIEILVLFYKYGICPAVFRTFLRDPGTDIFNDCIQDLMKIENDAVLQLFDMIESLGLNMTSFAELVKPMKNFPELIASSPDIEIDALQGESNVYYIGSGIARKATGNLSFLQPMLKGKRLIYATLGSQGLINSRILNIFFAKMIAVMKREKMQGFHLLLSTGEVDDNSGANTDHPNVTIVKWASQLAILEVASLAIFHGGFGGIKECIYQSVPMIITPVQRDQPANGKRIEHHGLGLTLSVETISEDELEEKILYVVNSPEIRESIAAMREKFIAFDKQKTVVGLIEKLIQDNNNRLEKALVNHIVTATGRRVTNL
jgi:zeaxanthin glucosyltransferase